MRFMIIVKARRHPRPAPCPKRPYWPPWRLPRATGQGGCAARRFWPATVVQGWRVQYAGGKSTVVDGPFAECKELVAGYTLIQVRTREEALEWSRRYPNPAGGHADAQIEVRQMFELDDFAPGEALDRMRDMDAGQRP